MRWAGAFSTARAWRFAVGPASARTLGLAGTTLPRFVAFLRGVSPTNAKMPELKRCFEHAGFANVRTVLSSGNVVFDSRSGSEASLEHKIESAMLECFGHSFYTIVRPSNSLRKLLETDPYARHGVDPAAKRIVSFLRNSGEPKLTLPLSADGARVLEVVGREVFTAYVPSEKGPVFMKLIERAFGAEVTTRTWETVKKCVAA